MSENPFEQPVSTSNPNHLPTGPSAPFPTTVMVICIICLILGLFGLIGACGSGVMLSMGEMLESVVPPEGREEFQKSMDLQFLPLLVQTVIGAIFAPMMVVACIGCLIRKPWGRSLFVIATAGFIIWNVITVAISLWMTIFHIETLTQPNAPAMGEEMARNMAYGGQIFGIVLSLAFLGFYIFAALHMKKQSVKDFYAA